MRVTKTTGLVRGLQNVAEFLNAIGPTTTQAHWLRTLKKIRAYYATSGPVISHDDAYALRQSMEHDLAFVRADSLPDRPFDNLIERLNSLHLANAWYCEPLATMDKRHASQAIFKLRWDDGTEGRWTVQSWPVTTTLAAYYYAMLGKALETGALTRLKVCRECGKYLVAADLKTRFCLDSRKCHDDYHNRLKQQNGTMAQTRTHQRKNALLRATRLLSTLKLTNTDESIKRLQAETHLPRRVVTKILENA